MRPVGKLLSGLLLVMAVGRGVGSPPDAVFEPLDADSSRFAFRVSLPQLALTQDPRLDTVQLDGFRNENGPGLPALPTRTVLVAVPGDAVPRIEIHVERSSEIAGVRPRPAPTRNYDVRPELEPRRRALEPVVRPGPAERVEVFEQRIESPAAYAGIYPAQPAHIAREGVLRDQRYVAVRLDPVRYDAERNALLVAERFVVTVHFEGARLAPQPLATDSPLEAVYRNAFLNYGQSRTFRAGKNDEGEAASTGGTDDPSARHRIRVAQDGIVRLDEARMAGTGFLAENLSSWKLTSNGVEVPLHVHDVNTNDLMDSTDFVQFYGQALDDEPKAILNYDFANPNSEDIFEARDFGDVRTYFLTVESGVRSRMPLVESTPTLTRTPPSDFEAVAHVEEDQAWRPLRDADPWYWIPTLSPNGTASRSDDVPLPGLASGTAPATIRVQLRSTSEDTGLNPDHRTLVTVKNNSVQTLATDEQTYDGRIVFLHDIDWTHGGGAQLSDPLTVDLEALTVSGANHSVILDWIEVTYRRSFGAVGGLLEFGWIDGDAEFIVDGLTSSNVEVYEITDRVGATGVVDSRRLDPMTLQVSGSGPFSVRFRVDDALTGAERRFVVFDPSAVSVPAGSDFEADTVSNLRDGANQAEMIIIAHPDVLDESLNGPLDQLRSLRLSQGIDSIVARLPDVEDEFNDGHPGPVAIEKFLDFVMNGGWADPKPSYVLLLGDGSYDYKGGTAEGNFVPTWIMFLDRPELGYYASDNRMGAVVGPDPLTDVTFGRIPARTVLEANTMLQKLVDYEQMPPPDDWSRHGLFVADRGKNFDQGEAVAFETTNQEAADTMPAPYTTRQLRYRTDFNEVDANGMRQEIKHGVNGSDTFFGAALVQFVGHGNFDLWSDDVFFCGNAASQNCINRGLDNDTDDFTNGLELPWMMAQNCLTGGFHGTALESMGESWIKKSGGGAMGVFSPTGLSFNFIGDTVSGLVFDDLFGPAKIREVRTPMQTALTLLCGDESVEPCQHYVYLGDPASRLQLPSVEAPSNIVTQSGDTTITLSWDGPDGGTFDVYRADGPNLTYQKVNGSPIGVKQFTDTGLLNGVFKYYYVIAVDAEGFESAWSNFNSDCDLDGPDCVKERALNPNPPASPTGVNVVDQETGGALAVTWSPNGEGDLKNYTVHWGLQSGVYSWSQGAGRSTSAILSGLEDGTTYFIAVTATNTSDKTSPFNPAEERTGVPSFVRGIRAPGFVADLVVDKAANGTDVALSWGAVTQDIYGSDATITTYEVYRGETPDFTPSSINRVATVGTTSWDDPGALTAGPDYHYLVRAVNGDGDGGGLGNQLPNGIEDLTLDRAVTPGNVVLSWSPVIDTWDGDPVVVDHYEVYASDSPFLRADICDPLDDGCTGLTPIQSPTGTSIEITPAAQSRYYSVLAVDARGNKSPF